MDPKMLQSFFAPVLGIGLAHEPRKITKGWSQDLKYHLEAMDGKQYLLRLLPASQLEAKRLEQFYLQQLPSKKLFSIPLAVGEITHEGHSYAYTLTDWIHGDDAEEKMGFFPKDMQYQLGLKAGQMLQDIHRIPVVDKKTPWEVTFDSKITRKLVAYESCSETFEEAQFFLDVIQEYRHLIKGRPSVFMHGDFHIGNMVITPNHDVGIIDFNRFDFGDPYDEFNRMMFTADTSPHFATGIIQGYFNHHIPDDFFPLMMLYNAVNQIGSIPWAIPLGKAEVENMKVYATKIAKSYRSVMDSVPKWYLDIL